MKNKEKGIRSPVFNLLKTALQINDPLFVTIIETVIANRKKKTKIQ